MNQIFSHGHGDRAAPYPTEQPAIAPAMMPGDSESLGGESPIRRYLRILNKRRWAIGAAVAVAVLVGLALALLAQPQYRAAATLEIAREADSVVDMEGAQPARAADPEFYQTQYSLLQSRSLAEAVVQDLRLAQNEQFLSGFGSGNAEDLPESREAREEIATQIVMANTEIVPVRLSSIVNVEYSSPDPAMAAAVANSLADNFIESTLERRYEAASYARNFLQTRLNEIRQRLEDSERQAVAYAGQNELVNVAPTASSRSDQPVPEQTLVGASLAEANAALAQARTERIAAQNRLRQASRQPSQALENSALNSLRQQRAELRAQYQKQLSDFAPEYPTVRALAAQVKELDQQIAAETQRISGTVSSELSARYREAAANESQLEQLVERLTGSLLDQRRRGIQYGIFQRDVDTNSALYDALLQRYKEIGVAGGVGTNNVSIVDPAVVPDRPYSPNLLLNVLLSLLVGTVLGALLALLLEHLDDHAILPEEVQARLGLPLLGSVPVSDSDAELQDLLADPKTPISEAYMSLLTGLRFTTSHGTPKTLLMTSSQPGEGKSTTSLALAHYLSKVGKRVLLIDADMRNPSLHKVLHLENSHGLSNLLIGEASIQEFAHTTATPNLMVLTSGPIPPNPAELLSSDRVDTLLATAASQFDHVLIDTAPVLGLADAPLLSRAAEGTIFVLEAGRTTSQQARIALQRLRAVKANLLGVVQTKLDVKKSGYGYGYGYDYTYGEGGSGSTPASDAR